MVRRPAYSALEEDQTRSDTRGVGGAGSELPVEGSVWRREAYRKTK